MSDKQQYGYLDNDFVFLIEPETGINTAADFTNELFAWAAKEKKDLVITEESMEPHITMDGQTMYAN